MSLIFADGFDAYNTADEILRKWDNAQGTRTLQTGYAGSGKGYRLQSSGRIWTWLNDEMTKVVGMNIMREDHGEQKIIFYLAGRCNSGNIQFDNNVHIMVQWNTDGTLQVTTTGSVVHAGTTVLTTSSWNHIELKVLVHASAGEFELRINGNLELSASGIAIQNATTLDAPMRLALGQNGGSTGNITFDDVYVLDGDGSVNNDFLGPCLIDTLYPDADEDCSWDTSTGTDHYVLVDDTAVDDDTTYVQSSVPEALDLYHVNNLPNIPQDIYGVLINADLCNAGDSLLGFHLVVRSDLTDHETTATRTINQEYTRVSTILELEPTNDVPWTRSTVEDAFYGYKIEAEE